MNNKYLEKIAEKSDHLLRGWVSPAWQENSIARDHGKEGLSGVTANVKQHLAGSFRASGRGIAEGTVGAAGGALSGAAVAALLKKNPKVGAVIGGHLGYLGGNYTGVHHSLKNQAAEHHKKYASEDIATGAAIGAGVGAATMHKAIGSAASTFKPAVTTALGNKHFGAAASLAREGLKSVPGLGRAALKGGAIGAGVGGAALLAKKVLGGGNKNG